MLCLALISIPIISHAGFYGPTSHSRANCAGFNESVAWWFAHPDYRRSISYHFRNERSHAPTHSIDTGMIYSFRAAAYHATEAYSSRGDAWRVIGYHYYKEGRNEKVGAVSGAIDCNIYDGWWDH